MELQLKCLSKDINGLSLTSLVVSDKIFKYPFNPMLIHQVISSYLNNSRQGTKSQKSRGMVSGSNKKPWRQKGTGRARAGSLKSPIWRSGGVTFASKPKIYRNKVNKKMYQRAIKSILSKLVCENRLFVIENLFIDQPKTQLLLKKLKQITLSKSVLIFTDMLDKNLILASRNLYKIEIRNLINMDPVSLVNFDVILMTRTIINIIEKKLI